MMYDYAVTFSCRSKGGSLGVLRSGDEKMEKLEAAWGRFRSVLVIPCIIPVVASFPPEKNGSWK